jgi:hypothetical protein
MSTTVVEFETDLFTMEKKAKTRDDKSDRLTMQKNRIVIKINRRIIYKRLSKVSSNGLTK